MQCLRQRSGGVLHSLPRHDLGHYRMGVTLPTSGSARVRPFEDMPGPRGPPYFGTYFHYKLGILNVHKLFDVVKSWHSRYGTVFREVCLGKTVVHVAEPEAIRKVFATEGRHPRIEPIAAPSGFYRLQKGLGPGLGNTNDEEWYKLRSAVQQLMMRPQEMAAFLPGADQVALDFVSFLKTVRQADLQVTDMGQLLGRWVLESNAAHCFDTRLGYLEEGGREEAERLIEANDKQFEALAKLLSVLPLYQHTRLVTPKWTQLFDAEDTLYHLLVKHLQAALQRLKQKQASGQLGEGDLHFLRHLLASPKLAMKDVVILTLSLLIDPLSTVRAQMQYLMYLLSTHPHVQQRLWEEVSAVAPPFPSPLTPQHLSAMRYFRACFQESVRLMPVINENRRFTGKDLVLDGFHVPANTLVYLNSYVLYRDPAIFVDPDAFRPERWLRGNTGPAVDPSIVNTGPAVDPSIVNTGPAVDPFIVNTGPAVDPSIVNTGPAVDPSIVNTGPAVDPSIVNTGPAVDPSIVRPFSHGPRMCVGRRFAELDMAVLMTRIVQNFRLEWHHGELGMRFQVLNFPDRTTPFTLHDR